MAKEYGAYKLEKSTIEFLRRMKMAFELSYEKEFTNDEFIRQMAASVEDGDLAVWEIYCELDQTMERLAAKGRQRTNKGV